MSNNLQAVLQDLYKSEINFNLSTFWDAGYTIQLGDDMNGFKDESEMLDSLDDVAVELVRMTTKHFPDSDFAKKYIMVGMEGWKIADSWRDSYENI